MSDKLDITAVKLASLVAEICVESSSVGLLKKAGDLLPQMLNLDGFMILAEVEHNELPIICSGGKTPKSIVFNDSAFSEDILYGVPAILNSQHITDIDDRELSKQNNYICSLFGGKKSTGYLAIGIKKSSEELTKSQIELFTKTCQIVGNSYQIVLKLENDSKILEEKNRNDSLTNLLTHRSFLQELGNCMGESKKKSKVLACLVVSLDSFTSFNNQYGYEIGNELLFEIGSLLQNFVRDDDVIGRIGGDQFGIVLNDVTSSENAVIVANRLGQIFNKNLLPVAKNLTASIGIALFPQDSTDNEILIAKAEKAAKQAKKIPGTHSSFSSEFSKSATENTG